MTGSNGKTHVCVLASTSAGNCTAIWNDRVSILVDCGTNVTYTEETLRNLGLSLDRLTAVFITHSHGDHANRYTIKRLAESRVPVYCHHQVAPVLRKIHSALRNRNGAVVPFSTGGDCTEHLSFEPFKVPHDSDGGCFGYSFFFHHPGLTRKISIATDIGSAGADMVEQFADSDIIVIESNHDCTMLMNSSRPQWLKDRIVKTGHLSNDECSVFIREVLARSKKNPTAIILAHISQECNTNHHAKTAVHSMLAGADKPHIAVVETFKEKPSIVVKV